MRNIALKCIGVEYTEKKQLVEDLTKSGLIFSSRLLNHNVSIYINCDYLLIIDGIVYNGDIDLVEEKECLIYEDINQFIRSEKITRLKSIIDKK